MTDTEDDDFELPPEELGDGPGTLGFNDDTLKSNLVDPTPEAPDLDLSLIHI